MNKKNIKINSLEAVLTSANAAYDKDKKEKPHSFPEEGRIHFVQGWLEQAYKNLYNQINSK